MLESYIRYFIDCDAYTGIALSPLKNLHEGSTVPTLPLMATYEGAENLFLLLPNVGQSAQISSIVIAALLNILLRFKQKRPLMIFRKWSLSVSEYFI